MGVDAWQPARMQDAYDAASALSFKMFVSFDMTSLDCSSTQTIVAMMQRFAAHPAQLKTSAGEMWVSTFAGDACGASMWQTTLDSAGHSYRFVPAFFNDISSATMKSQYPVIGGDFLVSESPPRTSFATILETLMICILTASGEGDGRVEIRRSPGTTTIIASSTTAWIAHRGIST